MISAARPPDLSMFWESVKADFDGAKTSTFVRRRTGLAPSGGSADYHIRNERQYLDFMEKARDMSRNDSVIGKTIEKAATNVVQDGFTLRPDTGDEAINKDLAAKWSDWANDADQCDIQGEATFREMEHLWVQSELRDGDIISLGTRDGSLQNIEGHLCRNPYRNRAEKVNAIIGVELDRHRKAKRYHIRQETTDSYKTPQSSSSRAYDARDANGHRQVFHYHVKERFSATRGVTCLAPVFQIAGMFEDVNFAKVVQAQLVSCFAVMRYQDETTKDLPSVSHNYGNPTTESTTNRMQDEIKPGMEYSAKTGERLEGFSPNVPNPEYFDHAKLLLTMIGINIGVPYVEMMMDASETNFSGWKGATATAKKNWRRNQIALRERKHENIYRWKARQFMVDDPALRNAANRNGVNILRHRWIPPAWPYSVQPVEEAAGQLLRVRNGLTSPRRLHAEMSQEWPDIAREIVEDNGMAIELAIARADVINSNLPEGQTPVHWREILSLPTPDGVQIAIPAAIPKTETADAT